VEGLLLWGWLGGYKYEGGQVKCGQLLTIEDLGEILHSTPNFLNYIQPTNSAQSLSTSRTAMSSTSPSRSTCSHSSHSWRSWYVKDLRIVSHH
jgi:hypothetical protein